MNSAPPSDPFSEDWESIRTATVRIEQGIKEWTVGWNNTAGLRELRAHASSILHATTDHYIREKAGSLSASIEELFSSRKHVRGDGVDRVKQNIREDCSKIRGYVQSRV